jgi:VIT1/CCC1 family predicted Fe2+/Mn2+ transporter
VTVSRPEPWRERQRQRRLDWYAAITLVCAAGLSLSVLALTIGYAARGQPLPGPLSTALGLLAGVTLAYLVPGPRR